MNSPAVALDTNALTAWNLCEPEFRTLLADRTAVLPAPVLFEALRGWVLLVSAAEKDRKEDRLGLALERLHAFQVFVRLSRYTQVLPHNHGSAGTDGAERLLWYYLVGVLPYSAAAQSIYHILARGRGSRSRRDLRIAAVCIAHDVPLLTRILPDFNDIPELKLETW
jgi:hypothetical protein